MKFHLAEFKSNDTFKYVKIGTNKQLKSVWGISITTNIEQSSNTSNYEFRKMCKITFAEYNMLLRE